MSLFQHSVLNKYLKEANQDEMDAAFQRLTLYFHNPEIQQNIRESKEEQFQEGFLRELFVTVLGYTINPTPDFNLTTEFKNERGAKKADGAILKDGSAIAVIELKSTKTKDLESIRLQAFDYKANQSKCVYVITSNFEKVRFYINNAVDFEEFDLFKLKYEDFQLFWLCLAKENLLKGVPLAIKEASIIEEEKVTKYLYRDYSLFKRDLYADLIKNNLKLEIFSGKDEKEIKLLLFKKSQKLLDRFLFILFGEDRLLLPPNSITIILDDWKKLAELDEYKPLYSRFKKYFKYLDQGFKGEKYDIFAYNGGLFFPDVVLDNILISDEVLQTHTQILTTYDFETDVDVNILGHIFENSLSEIEEITAQIEGAEVDLKKSKRKKDGVFYTPKYITKYIVENTVGKLCDEKRNELGINEINFNKNYLIKTPRFVKVDTEISGKKGIISKKTSLSVEGYKHLKTLEQYRSFLFRLTILDPACGSGAFLNQALDFLIKEHGYLTEKVQRITGDISTMFIDIENQILENNIFGVDINEESVDIAKLSLWLRTAKKGRKLTTLSNNIKCGNSLIDNPEVAGEKAFNWLNEFPEVFKNGGFDVVIGNPPYLRIQGLKDSYPELCSYYLQEYQSATGNYDIYVLFIEKSLELISKQGITSFILPHKFLIADFGIGVRNFLAKNSAIANIVHFGSELVFQDATTYTCIINLSKKKKEKLFFAQINPNQLFNENRISEIQYSKLSDDQWILTSNDNSKILEKINKQSLKLKDVFARFVQGIITGKDAVFCIKGELTESFLKVIDENGDIHKIERDILKPHLRGEDVNKFRNLENNEWLIFPYSIVNDKAELKTVEELERDYPNTLNYLKVYEGILREREKGKFNNDYWYQYSRNQAISVLEQPKIITPEVCFGGSMTFDQNYFYHNSKCHTLLLKQQTGFTYKSILPLINSSLFWFYLVNTGNILRGGYIGVKRKVLEPFSIPNPERINIIKLENYTDLMLERKAKLQLVLKAFRIYLSAKFHLVVFSKKLQNWHELEFADFIKELNKAIKKVGGSTLSKMDEMEWMEVFETKKAEAQNLKSEIDKTDREIDQMVYELYGLTEEEIGIVERSSM